MKANRQARPVDRYYDIFEKMPDGSSIWKDFVPGLEKAQLRLAALSEESPNEFYAMYVLTKEIVARVNIPSQK